MNKQYLNYEDFEEEFEYVDYSARERIPTISRKKTKEKMDTPIKKKKHKVKRDSIKYYDYE